MPLYEYRCTACGALTDVRHGFDETYSDACASCGGSMTKNFNVGGIVFKGSGFYINDSRGGSSESSGSAPAPAPAPAASPSPAPAPAPSP